MAIEKDVFQMLTLLDLTNTQAKVYLTLVKLEKATGKTISRYSKLARSEIYRVLSELQEKGLVEKIIATPTEFAPIPINECLSILIARKKNKISEYQESVIQLLQKLKAENSSETLQVEEYNFILIPGKEAVALKTTKALDNAQTSLDSIVSSKKFLYLMFNLDKFRIEEALKRGVKMRFIMERPEDEKQVPKIVESLEKNYFFKVKYLLSASRAHIGLVDKKEVFLNTSTTAGLTETPLLWSNNPSLVAVAQDYFEILWFTAAESSLQDPLQT